MIVLLIFHKHVITVLRLLEDQHSNDRDQKRGKKLIGTQLQIRIKV